MKLSQSVEGGMPLGYYLLEGVVHDYADVAFSQEVICTQVMSQVMSQLVNHFSGFRPECAPSPPPLCHCCLANRVFVVSSVR